MADTRLSDLSAAGSLSASDLFYVVQTPGSGGEKATGTQLLTLVGTTYVPLAGGTMTGALTLPAGAIGTPSLNFTGAGATTGIYSAGANNISFGVNGTRIAYINHEAFLIDGIAFLSPSNAVMRFGGGGVADVYLQRLGNYRLGMYDVLQVSPVSLEIYGKYTDINNYERLTLTGVAGTSVNITAETLGTGGDNLDIVLTPAGTGSVYVPIGASAAPGIRFIGTDAGFWYEGGLLHCRGQNANAVNWAMSAAGTRYASDNFVGWASGSAYSTSADTALARNAAGIVEVNNGTLNAYRDLKLRNLIQTAYHEVAEMTAPAAPATNSVRIYAEDNGSGKTRLMALFATGAAQQIAIEP